MKNNDLRKSLHKKLGLVTGFTAMALFASTTMAHENHVNLYDVKEAQMLVKQFGGQLKPALKKAMKEGGPVAAVKVCQEKAPAIAADIARQSGWNITRVSLKPRGANATPDEWETKVLEHFEAQKGAGAEVKTLQFSEVMKSDNGNQFRYMKAVGTEGICLTCHGTSVAKPVKQALAKFYPNDKATGYQKGDIRGAFSFSKEVK